MKDLKTQFMLGDVAVRLNWRRWSERDRSDVGAKWRCESETGCNAFLKRKLSDARLCPQDLSRRTAASYVCLVCLQLPQNGLMEEVITDLRLQTLWLPEGSLPY